jgi:hypothetical protein
MSNDENWSIWGNNKVHDWRNYVPDEIKVIWDTLTPREKELIQKTAEVPAFAEEWD